MFFSEKERIRNLEKMSETPLDLLVIGGGITGAGITLDAITRGLQVATVEMKDFASGTSSRSTKLVHGGLRYLKQGDVKTVAEVGQERAIVYENAPHVTTPVKMILPFYKGGTFGPYTTAMGLDIYDALARVKKSERKFMLNKEQSLKREPYLKQRGLKGTGVYVEYRTNDSRLTLETMKKAAEYGALIANYTKVEKLLYSNTTNQIIGVRVRDVLQNKEYAIYAKKVINAAGPWVDRLRLMDNSKKGKHLLLTKGVHLVFDAQRFPLHNAVYFDTPFNDKRMMFAIPREDKVYVGTTDTVYEKEPSDPGVTMTDVHYILDAINGMFDIEPLHVTDIESSWSGVRPLIHEEGKSPSEISRKDEIFHSESGMYSIAGGKLTGYRKMAEQIIDVVLKDLHKEYRIPFSKCKTRTTPLSGGNVGGDLGFQSFLREHIRIGMDKYNLTEKEASKLVHRYGSNVLDVFDYLAGNVLSHLPTVDYAMLHFSLEHEMCMSPVDFLLRRSSFMLFDMAHCKEIADAVIEEMSHYYNWSATTTENIERDTWNEINRHLDFQSVARYS